MWDFKEAGDRSHIYLNGGIRLASEEARWSTSKLEALIQEAVTTLSDALHELEHRGSPALSDSAIALERLHEYIQEFRVHVAENSATYGVDAEDAQHSLQGLLKVARLADQHQKLQAIASVLEDLQQLRSRLDIDGEEVDTVKKSALQLLQEMSDQTTETMDEYLQRTHSFVALHRWLTAGELADEDWENFSNLVASGLSKGLSIAAQRGRLYFAADYVRSVPEEESGLVSDRAVALYEAF